MFFSSRSTHFSSRAQASQSAVAGETTSPLSRSLPLLSNRLRAADLGGNSIASATSAGTFPGKAVIRDTVSRKDPDIFKVAFTGNGNVRLTFQNFSQSTLVGSIMDSRGQVLRYKGNLQTANIAAGKSLKTFYQNIPAGTYYLRLQNQNQQPGKYKLAVGVVDPSIIAPDCGCGS